jgi:hypothetical protein
LATCAISDKYRGSAAPLGTRRGARSASANVGLRLITRKRSWPRAWLVGALTRLPRKRSGAPLPRHPQPEAYKQKRPVNPLVGRATAEELDLQEAHGVDVGIAKLHRASERSIALEQRGGPLNSLHPLDGACVLRTNLRPDSGARRGFGELGIALGHTHVALGKNHLHVPKDRPEERPAPEHCREQVGSAGRDPTRSSALPTPYQPGGPVRADAAFLSTLAVTMCDTVARSHDRQRA